MTLAADEVEFAAQFKHVFALLPETLHFATKPLSGYMLPVTKLSLRKGRVVVDAYSVRLETAAPDNVARRVHV